MTPRELYDHINADHGLIVLGVSDDGKVIVTARKGGYKTAIDLRGLADLQWDDLRAILHGEKEPNPIYHVSRVVGYMSRIENWNASKIAELHDRHNGNYQV